MLRAVVDQMPAGVVVVEARTRRLVAVNAEAARILGIGEPRGETLPELGAWEVERGGARAAAEWPIDRALRGEAVDAECGELARPDGTRVALEVTSGPIRDPDGRVLGAVWTLWDVGERNRRERAEREFVTNAAHELRTPLTAISSAVEVLEAGAKEVPEERDRFLAHIDHECGRLARLATALLTLARAQGGVEAPRLELVELCPFLTQLAERLHPAEAVAVEVDCPTDLAAAANGELLEQALQNLASNAARHTRKGSIVLGARRVGDHEVAIEIRDTGEGMAEEERARMTERFYRGSDDDGGGFGLGLAIAADSIRAIGAELELESEPGRGTTARVRLPSARLVSA